MYQQVNGNSLTRTEKLQYKVTAKVPVRQVKFVIPTVHVSFISSLHVFQSPMHFYFILPPPQPPSLL